jgi:hypothetical protein
MDKYVPRKALEAWKFNPQGGRPKWIDTIERPGIDNKGPIWDVWIKTGPGPYDNQWQCQASIGDYIIKDHTGKIDCVSGEYLNQHYVKKTRALNG